MVFLREFVLLWHKYIPCVVFSGGTQELRLDNGAMLFSVRSVGDLFLFYGGNRYAKKIFSLNVPFGIHIGRLF